MTHGLEHKAFPVKIKYVEPKMLLHIYTKRNNFEDTALERSITQIYIKSRSKKKIKFRCMKQTEQNCQVYFFFISLLKSLPAPDLLVLLQLGRFQSLKQI